MLKLSELFPTDLIVDGISTEDSKITIRLISTKPNCECPNCKRKSSRIHSQYQRGLKDLPIMDKKAIVR